MISNISISIIIATYNRAAFLSPLLESIIVGNRDIFLFGKTEILIIDNNSNDNTYSIVAGYVSQNPFIKYFVETKQGLSHGRNRGIREAKGEILVFLDDDVEVEKSWLFYLIRPIIENVKVGVVGGRVLPFQVSTPIWLP